MASDTIPPASREHAELVAALSVISTSIATLGGELRTAIAKVQTEIASLRGELHTEVANLRGELHTEIATLNGRLSLIYYRLLVSLGGAIVVVGGLVLAVLRLLPSAHVGG